MFAFFQFKMRWSTYVYSAFLNINRSLAKIGPPKNDNFSQKKTQITKENVLLQPPNSPRIGVFKACPFWKDKHFVAE